MAGVSLTLSVAAAFYIGRTIIQRVRSLEASMHRVETGDLEAVADVKTDDEIGHLAAAFNRMTDGLRREAMVRHLFGQCVSPEVDRLAIEQRGQLAGQVVECTVMFVDIRRFTALAEVLPPARLIGTLNRYVDRMLAKAEGGIVNKFGGDSLLAVFGSPLNPMPDHAERAMNRNPHRIGIDRSRSSPPGRGPRERRDHRVEGCGVREVQAWQASSQKNLGQPDDEVEYGGQGMSARLTLGISGFGLGSESTAWLSTLRPGWSWQRNITPNVPLRELPAPPSGVRDLGPHPVRHGRRNGGRGQGRRSPPD